MCNRLMSVPATAQIGTVGVQGHELSARPESPRSPEITDRLHRLPLRDPRSVWRDFQLREDTMFVFKAYIFGLLFLKKKILTVNEQTEPENKFSCKQ